VRTCEIVAIRKHSLEKSFSNDIINISITIFVEAHMNISPVSGYNRATNLKGEQAPKTESNQQPKTRINWGSVTGWTTAGALATAGVSGLKNKPKLHFASAVIAMFAGASHVAITTYYHEKHHHQKSINTVA